MRIRPRGAAEDCCCSSLNDKVKWLMERIGGTVRKLIINGNEYTPDGDGTVTLDTGAFVDVDDHLDDDSMKPIANKPVAEAIDALDDEDSRLDGRIDYIAGVVSGVSAEVGQLQTDVSGQGSQISAMQGSIAGLAADNSYTRGVAQAAKDTADGMAERLTDLETNDTVQQSQIGQLIVADQANAKLTGDNAFTGNNSFAVNPKAAAPASGAVDNSVVNANWASQTGDDAPNNLGHRLGNETFLGYKLMKYGVQADVISKPAGDHGTNTHYMIVKFNRANSVISRMEINDYSTTACAVIDVTFSSYTITNMSVRGRSIGPDNPLANVLSCGYDDDYLYVFYEVKSWHNVIIRIIASRGNSSVMVIPELSYEVNPDMTDITIIPGVIS